VEVDGTRMEHHSAWHQFVCRIWLSRNPLWCLLLTSTYAIILTALERYIAVVYPIWYKVDRYTAKMSTYPCIFRAACFNGTALWSRASLFRRFMDTNVYGPSTGSVKVYGNGKLATTKYLLIYGYFLQ